LGDWKGIWPVKKTLGVGSDILNVCLIAPVVVTTSIIPCSHKIQNGDILVPANPGPPGKWPLKWRESVLFRGNRTSSPMYGVPLCKMLLLLLLLFLLPLLLKLPGTHVKEAS